MIIAVSSDHAGYPLKEHLVSYLRAQGHEVLDFGVGSAGERADYPDTAASVARSVQHGDVERGIAICGSGIGVCIAANKFEGIYASIAHDTFSAAQGVEHDRMNVLCLGAQIVGTKVAETLVDAFLGAVPLEIDRYLVRFQKVQSLEQGGGKG
jgi:ribose 5-phosphate isomerase B